MTIKIIVSDDKAPVLCQYPQQCQPQPAYLEFDPSAEEVTLDADYNAEIGNAVPSRVWHGLVIRFSIPPLASRDGIAALSGDEWLEAKLLAAKAAYQEVWNGSNFVGRFSGLDECWAEEIEGHLAANLAETEAWPVEDWISQSLALGDLIKFGGIAAYAADYERCADEDGVVLIGDAEKQIAEWAEDECQRYIRQKFEGDAEIEATIKFLVEFNSSKYSYLLDDYREEFGGE